ncbi:MAG TPA: enoyl-CoA hydratase/isomerase family protein [Acidimicrobiales bacterium]|nr:enoyl-CoA hydratase/isomerase family protein [Acidimicrobiales bacterium]
MDDPVLLEVKGGVAVLTLNRPARHNAIGDAMDALFFRYLDLVRSDRDVRVVVWRGAGESFSCGRDMAELVGGEPAPDGTTGTTPPGGTPVVRVGSDAPVDLSGRGGTGPAPGYRRPRAQHGFGPSDFEVLERSQWGLRMLADFPVPIVCALKGWTLGTAFERALLCDVRIAGEGTHLALAGIDHGVIPDGGGLAKLHEIGGSALALDLGLTGRRVEADEALRLGLVSQVVPDDRVDEMAAEVAAGIAERPPLVVRMVREHVQGLAAGGVRATLGRELIGQTLVLASHDFEEQRQARAEDREPRYERR